MLLCCYSVACVGSKGYASFSQLPVLQSMQLLLKKADEEVSSSLTLQNVLIWCVQQFTYTLLALQADGSLHKPKFQMKEHLFVNWYNCMAIFQLLGTVTNNHFLKLIFSVCYTRGKDPSFLLHGQLCRNCVLRELWKSLSFDSLGTGIWQELSLGTETRINPSLSDPLQSEKMQHTNSFLPASCLCMC